MGNRAYPTSVDDLARALLELPIEVDRAILFGSRARGDYLEDSDWDVVLVSEDFEGIPVYKRAVPLLLSIAVSGVEMHCYTPKELEDARGGFSIAGVALEEGIDLVQRDKGD